MEGLGVKGVYGWCHVGWMGGWVDGFLSGWVAGVMLGGYVAGAKLPSWVVLCWVVGWRG